MNMLTRFYFICYIEKNDYKSLKNLTTPKDIRQCIFCVLNNLDIQSAIVS